MGGKYNPETYKKYYEANKEKKHQQQKEWREKNLEEVREKDRLRDSKRTEYKKEHNKKYCELNKEKVKAQKKLYREQNKEKISLAHKEWYRKSREGLVTEKAPGAYNVKLAERHKEKWLLENLYLYKLKMTEKNGFEFYKYGLTKDIKTRLHNIPYKAEILEIEELSKYDAIYKEIELLKNVDDNRLVIMAKDEEGNGFSPLYELDDESTYEADSDYSGEIGIEKLTPELKKRGFSEEDMNDGVPALVLWPTN